MDREKNKQPSDIRTEVWRSDNERTAMAMGSKRPCISCSRDMGYGVVQGETPGWKCDVRQFTRSLNGHGPRPRVRTTVRAGQRVHLRHLNVTQSVYIVQISLFWPIEYFSTSTNSYFCLPHGRPGTTQRQGGSDVLLFTIFSFEHQI